MKEVIDLIRVRTGAQESSNSLTPSEQMRHFKELETALYGVGITTERLYEPHLTTWVRRELSGQVTDPTLRQRMGLDDEGNSVPSASVSPRNKTPAGMMAEVLDAMGYRVEDIEEVAVALARNQPGSVGELISRGEVLQDAINLIRTGNGETLRDFISFLRDNSECMENTEDRALLASQLFSIIQHSPGRGVLLRLFLKLLS